MLLRLISSVFHQSFESVSRIGSQSLEYPALLTRISSLPHFSLTRATAALMLSSEETSSLMLRMLGTSDPASLAAATNLASMSEELERAATAIPDAPARENDRAVAAPIPLDVPVIMT